MFKGRPDIRLLGFPVELTDEEEVPGLHNFRPSEEVVPGLHNFKPPEEVAPGFRMDADGSIGEMAPTTTRLHPDIGGNPFGFIDRSRLDDNAFTPFGDGTPPPYLAFARKLYGELGIAPTLDPRVAQPAGMASFAPASSSPSPSGAPSFAGTAPGGLPLSAPRSPSMLSSPTPSDGPRLLSAPLSDTMNPSSASGQHSPLSFTGPIPGKDPSMTETHSADSAASDASLASNGRSPSDPTTDPNIVRVANPAPVDNEIQIAQQQETPRPKLQKDPSPGVVVVLPDGSTIADPQSPTGKLMAPVADLNAVAEAGRETRERFRALGVSPIAARLYLAAALGLNVGQAGTFDYQRRGNRITGYTHLQQFEKVSNLNVGLFAQQAGLSLDEVLDIAGTFARNFSSNTDPSQPHGLSATQFKFITRGYQLGESGIFDKSPTR